MEINHGYSAKAYVDWKFEALKSICISCPKKQSGNGNRVAYRFWTRQHPELTDLHRRFYRRRKKVIPDDFELDPIALSVWFMDDGSRCSRFDFYFNTQQFTLEDQRRLLEKLKEVGIQANLNRDKIYYRIRLLSSSIPRLKELVSATLIPEMQYKIGL